MKKLYFIGLIFALGMAPWMVHALGTSPTTSSVETVANQSILLNSPLFTQYREPSTYQQTTPDMTGFQTVLDNPKFTLFVDPTGMAIRVFNKTTGYYWMSDLDNINSYGLNAIWKRRVRSAVEISYRDANDLVKTAQVILEDVTKSYSVVNDHTVHFDIDFAPYGIALAYNLELSEEGIRIHLEDESIVESIAPGALETNPNAKPSRLVELTFFPFFGAVYQASIPGYAFIPSGNGALVNFGSNSVVNRVFVERFYGDDFARVSDNTEGTPLSVPVYGMVHGEEQNAFFVHINEGEENAYLKYYPTGVQTQLHMVQSPFIFREPYVQSIPGSSDVSVIPEDRYHYDIDVSYYFLSNEQADYVGMALTYQQLLEDQDLIHPMSAPTQLPIQVSAFGGDYERGLLWNTLHVMTSSSQLQEINDDLMNHGINDPLYVLRGYNQDGASKMSYENYAFSSQYGALNDISTLNKVFLYDPMAIYTSDWNPPGTTLQSVNKFYVTSWISENEYKHYQHVSLIADAFPKAQTTLNQQGGIALDGLSNQLYSDPYENRSRTSVMEQYQSLPSSSIPMMTPNEYMFSKTSAYLNMDFYHSRLKFVTDSVPFLQIALSGYIPYYSPYLNFSSNPTIDRLKAIEYGAYPSFLITSQPSYLLSNTMSSEMYATHYDTVKETLVDDYAYIQEALTPVLGEKIVDREILGQGISLVTYESGSQVLVNYSNQDYVFGTQVVGPLSYFVKEGTV